MINEIKEIIEAEDFHPCWGEMGKYDTFEDGECDGCFFDKGNYCAYEQFMLCVKKLEEEG